MHRTSTLIHQPSSCSSALPQLLQLLQLFFNSSSFDLQIAWSEIHRNIHKIITINNQDGLNSSDCNCWIVRSMLINFRTISIHFNSIHVNRYCCICPFHFSAFQFNSFPLSFWIIEVIIDTTECNHWVKSL